MKLAWQRLLEQLHEGDGHAQGGTDEPAKPNGGTPPNARSRRRDDDDEPGEDDPIVSGDKWRTPSDYERTLRKENQKYRQKSRAAEQALEAAIAKGEADKVAEAKRVEDQYKGMLAEQKKTSDERYIKFEVRAQLKEAGCQDIEAGLKLIDTSGIQITDTGEVKGVNDIITALQKDKAYLFTTASASSSSTATPPSAEPPKQKNAMEMSREEYAAERAKIAGTMRRS